MSLHLTRREMIAASLVFAASPVLAQETITVTDAIGSVEIPKIAKRIVVTDGDDVLQPTVALGIKPVGASRPNFTGGFAKGVVERLPADIGYIGTSGEPNYEAVLTMEPDLILMSNDDLPDQQGMYDRYSQIAPTVLIDVRPAEWRKTLTTVADVTGRQTEAQELLDRYDQRAKQVRDAIGSKIGTATIARVRTNLVRYMLQDTSFTWSVLKDLGFKAPPQQDVTGNDGFINISLERLDLLEADMILLLEDEGAKGAGAMSEKLRTLPTFANLRGEKVELPSADYLFGNILTAFNLLDMLEAKFKA
ncbi:iron-siderophore ABC transporter substrate-binding protein [Aliirhizobium smilacinae]|uniref:Iron-siderophore ABC transporter substrate-binding protein n=1 Tax=Aliirhizobium smilacinae TaxID=1395944 RepID=A0A5C4XJR4_9HYPH|nr:iron-siderophore ABC transporter substrate-binding protein [Rhizobium smilacinae]TNM63548.1 iron-siderophore ABC transporter substrate-binding protein [Rhizobium smilacinae]